MNGGGSARRLRLDRTEQCSGPEISRPDDLLERVRDVSSPIWGLPNPQPVRGCAVKGRKSLRAKASGKIAVRSEQRRRNGLSELPYTGRRPVAPPPPHEISRDVRGERVDVCLASIPPPPPHLSPSSSGSSRGSTYPHRNRWAGVRCADVGPRDEPEDDGGCEGNDVGGWEKCRTLTLPLRGPLPLPQCGRGDWRHIR